MWRLLFYSFVKTSPRFWRFKQKFCAILANAAVKWNDSCKCPSSAPLDHILFSNRSQIHSSLRHYEKALLDAEMACRLMPHWSKVRLGLNHYCSNQTIVAVRSCEKLPEWLTDASSLRPPACRATSGGLRRWWRWAGWRRLSGSSWCVYPSSRTAG